MGKHNVNIASMSLSRDEVGGQALTVLNLDSVPSPEVLAEIASKVDVAKMESVLMEEGVKKFADPQKALLKVIAEKRASLVGAK